MFALGLVNPRHLTLKRTAARGCSVPEAVISPAVGKARVARALRFPPFDNLTELVCCVDGH
jgi:hypothetical protein